MIEYKEKHKSRTAVSMSFIKTKDLKNKKSRIDQVWIESPIKDYQSAKDTRQAIKEKREGCLRKEQRGSKNRATREKREMGRPSLISSLIFRFIFARPLRFCWPFCSWLVFPLLVLFGGDSSAHSFQLASISFSKPLVSLCCCTLAFPLSLCNS